MNSDTSASMSEDDKNYWLGVIHHIMLAILMVGGIGLFSLAVTYFFFVR